MSDAFVANDFGEISWVDTQNTPEVPVDEVRLFEVLFSWKGEDHWREIRAPDFKRAMEEVKKTVEFPKGLDFYSLHRVSEDGASYDMGVSIPVERKEADYDS